MFLAMIQSMFIFATYKSGREIKHFIKKLLLSGTVKHIQRINYVKSYTRNEKNIIQREQKLLLLHTSNQQEDKMLKFCREFDTQ
jgi:uncharacterized protein involved in tolerance to divalent cations